MHGVKGALADGPRFVVDFANEKRFRLIAVPPVHDAGDIDVDDVSILENVVTWNAVAYDIVDAGAAAFGVSEVAEGGWGVSVLDGVIVCEPIDLAGGYTGLDETTEVIHQLSIESSGRAHSIALNFGKLQFAQVLQHLSLGSDAAWGMPIGRINLDKGKS